MHSLIFTDRLWLRRSPLASVPCPRHLKANQRLELPFRSETLFILLLWNCSSFGRGGGLEPGLGRLSETEIAGTLPRVSVSHADFRFRARAWKCRGDRKDETGAGNERVTARRFSSCLGSSHGEREDTSFPYRVRAGRTRGRPDKVSRGPAAGPGQSPRPAVCPHRPRGVSSRFSHC